MYEMQTVVFEMLSQALEHNQCQKVFDFLVCSSKTKIYINFFKNITFYISMVYNRVKNVFGD